MARTGERIPSDVSWREELEAACQGDVTGAAAFKPKPDPSDYERGFSDGQADTLAKVRALPKIASPICRTSTTVRCLWCGAVSKVPDWREVHTAECLWALAHQEIQHG